MFFLNRPRSARPRPARASRASTLDLMETRALLAVDVAVGSGVGATHAVYDGQAVETLVLSWRRRRR